MPKEYTIEAHRHLFAVWAAARASQRGWATIPSLKAALDETGIESFVANPSDELQFEQLHRTWCNSIVKGLLEKGVGESTFGRAAKLVNVYLKTMVVLTAPDSDVARFVHPPVDRILLQNISKDETINSEYRAKLKATSWTTLNETEYKEIINILRSINGDQPFWKIERYWTVY